MDFLSVLGLIFLVLKLVGVITWSWWWVLSPFLIEIGIVVLEIGIIVLSALIAILANIFD